jgi:hypothetical protein
MTQLRPKRCDTRISYTHHDGPYLVPESASLPEKGIDIIPCWVQACTVNPRYGLIAGAVIAGAVALVLATAPASWLADLLDITGEDAATFVMRRYAASATAALFVIATAIVQGASPHRAGLLAFAVWFSVQALVATVGIATGTVGGLAWLAVFIDPLIAAWFFVLSRTVQRDSPVHR